MDIELRKCRVCGEEKELHENFYFHSTTGYYQRKCIKCSNLDRRDKDSVFVDNKYIPYKKCSRCEIEKLRTEENFSFINRKGGYRKYRKMCLECEIEFNKLHSTRKRLPENDCNEIRLCRVCNTEKPACEFYPGLASFKNYRCIECDKSRQKRRKQEENNEQREDRLQKSREAYYRNRGKQLLQFYKKFDFERKYESNIDLEYLEESLKQSCVYCQFPSTGLDRINDKLGHTKENTVPCCSECNTAKMHNFSFEEMKKLGLCIRVIKEERIRNTTNQIENII